MAASMTALKKDLRKTIKTILADLPESAAATQSQYDTSHATRTLLAMPEYKAAKRISVYLSMPSGEISTSGIVRDALDQGKTVFIPYTYKPTEHRDGQPRSIMDMLELKSIDDFNSFEPDKWNIPTPSKASISSRANSFGGIGITEGANIEKHETDAGLDMIIMPGMAFDSNFGRLGHGMGFYDYFLRRCHRASQMPFRVGLSLTEQLLPPDRSVPMDSTDYRLDAFVLGNGELRRAET